MIARPELRKLFSDNDSLAVLVARELHADLLLLLSDVPGVFARKPQPGDEQASEAARRAVEEYKKVQDAIAEIDDERRALMYRRAQRKMDEEDRQERWDQLRDASISVARPPAADGSDAQGGERWMRLGISRSEHDPESPPRGVRLGRMLV